MRVKLILPALTEASSPYGRPIKYSLFPPLGLVTLAAYLSADWDADLQDKHVERCCTWTMRSLLEVILSKMRGTDLLPARLPPPPAPADRESFLPLPILQD